MKTSPIQAAAVCVALAFASQAPGAELPLPKEGWATWEVQAVEDSPAWCCWKGWDKGSTDDAICNLDGNHQGYGSRDNNRTDAIRMYARFSAGKVEQVRALAASCPVESKSPIQNLGSVATDDSARWLMGLTKTARNDVDEHSIAALAMHRGTIAFDAVNALARGDATEETRKNAIFWLAVLRGAPGADATASAMFSDQSADVRKHAAFAITQSKSARVTADLTRLGTIDKDGDVRAQAWFWLAHTGAPNVEDAIIAASKQDTDDHVREQAIFALSQLPDDRATSALIKAAEDRSLSAEQRKRALFWLAQSDSAGAQKYLDRMLTATDAR
jgi:hypothetical protein